MVYSKLMTVEVKDWMGVVGPGYQRLDKAIVTEMVQMAWIRLHLLSSRNPGLRPSILPCLYRRTCVGLGNATSTRDVATTRYSLFYFIQAPSVGPTYAPV
jgi:hypothetical protein